MRFILGFALIFALVSIIAIRVGTTVAADVTQQFNDINTKIERAINKL